MVSGVDTGNGQIHVIVDAGNEVLEQDENNNLFVVEGLVAGCPTPSATPEPEPEPQPEEKLIALYPAGQPVNITELHMLDATYGWAISEDEQAQHVLRTSDGGKTWVDVTPPQTTTVDPSGLLYYNTTAGFFLNAVTAWVIYYDSPVGGIGTIWRTQDGGRSWEPGWGLSSVPFTVGAFSSYPVLEFSDVRHGSLSIDYFLGTESSHALFKTSDGGQTWELVIHDGSAEAENWVIGSLLGMDFVDSVHGWAASQYFARSDNHAVVHIHWTDDGGTTWRSQELPSPEYCEVISEYVPALFLPQFGMLYAACDPAHTDQLLESSHDFLYVTTDAGRNWQINPLPGETWTHSIDIVNSKVIYLLKGKRAENQSEGRLTDPHKVDLYRSKDGGRTWTNVTTVGWYGDLNFVNEQVGWAVVQDDHDQFLALMHTTDGGQTWEQLAPQTASAGELPRWGSLPPQIKLPANRTILARDNTQEISMLVEISLEEVTDLAFDFGELATAQRNGWVTLWGMEGADYPIALHRHQDWVYDVKLYGILTASVSKDGTVFVRGFDNQSIQNLHGGEVTSVAFSPDEKTLATASQDRTVRIWNFDFDDHAFLKEAKLTLTGHTDWVWDVTFSPTGLTLASASSDSTVRLWDPNSGETLHVLRRHTSTVWRVEFSPDGKTLASASWDGTVKLWDVSTGEELAILRGYEGPVYGVAFSPDGKLLASGSADGTVIVWDVAQAEILSVLRGHTGPVRSVAFNPEGDILASASDDGTVKFWGVAP